MIDQNHDNLKPATAAELDEELAAALEGLTPAQLAEVQQAARSAARAKAAQLRADRDRTRHEDAYSVTGCADEV